MVLLGLLGGFELGMVLLGTVDFDMNQSFLSNFGWLQQICMVSVQRNKK